MRFRILQANMINDDYEWHLHAADCRDTLQPKYALDDLQVIWTAEDADAALASWIDDEMTEMGWTVDHVKVFGCTAPFQVVAEVTYDQASDSIRATLTPPGFSF